MDPTGLSERSVSSSEDLVRLVLMAREYPRIREATTTYSRSVRLSSGRVLEFLNSNLLVGNKTWEIELSKTGYIEEAGKCLVMVAKIAARKVVIVLLDAWGKYTRLGCQQDSQVDGGDSPFPGGRSRGPLEPLRTHSPPHTIELTAAM
jgi:serine-type D-Ala-D-Ala endopeptidase (penicillin-binding protein 7)